MLKDARTYQIIDPEHVGVRMTLPLGKHSGRHAFARACAQLGVVVAGEELNAAFRRFKERADLGQAVALEDIFEPGAGVSALTPAPGKGTRGNREVSPGAVPRHRRGTAGKEVAAA